MAIKKFSKEMAMLKEFIHSSKYIDITERRGICESFGVPESQAKVLFREEYYNRFLNSTKEKPITVSTICKRTGIPQKYATTIKQRLERRGKIEVAYLGQCPTTLSRNVQFIQFIDAKKEIA
jgi:hypothetical protein